MEAFALIVSGVLLGLQHSFEADHVAAVSTIVNKTKSIRQSSLIGAVWGLGHTATLLLIGMAMLVFKLAVPAWIGSRLELLVGVMLLVLGVGMLNRLRIGPHGHKNVGAIEVHSHDRKGLHMHLFKSFTIGMVHGLAGSGALILLVLSTVGSIAEGLIFIALFGIGSMAGMLAMGTMIGIPFKLSYGAKNAHGVLSLLAAIVSISLGIGILYDGYGAGLLL